MELGKNLRLIIFDFDGTLHDLDMDWTEARRSLGIEGTDESMGDAIERLKHEGNNESLNRLTALETAALEQSRLDDEVVRMIRQLKGRYAVAIFSRNSSAAIRHFLAANGVEVDAIVGREDVDRLKPSPEGLQKLMSQFNTDAHGTVLVGDTWHDLMVAKAQGIACIIVGNNFKHDSEIPRYRVNAIKDLPAILAN